VTRQRRRCWKFLPSTVLCQDHQWTKATIENPAKKEKYLKSFTLYVNGQEVYAKEIADALEADLQPLVTSGVIKRISKYDTNPANNPQPPQRPSKQ